jgi:DNA polymerase III subunit epsilon
VIPSGIRASAADSLLVVRAREALASGALDAVTLMERVCALPGAPQPVAERLAEALFARHNDFGRDGSGRWTLVRREPRRPTAPEVPAASASPTPSLLPAELGVAERPISPLERRHREVDIDDMLLHDMRFAVVDVETTGTSPASADRITEIAIVHVAGGEVVEAFETLVNPERAIPPAIIALTQITWEMVRDAPTFSRVANDVLSGLRERIFVAHNAAFDWRFVSCELARASGLQLSGDRLCTVRLARALLPQLPRKSLDSVTHYFGVEIAARHRAMGDALATAQVLTRLLRIAEDRGASTWGALSELLAGRAPRVRRKRSAWPRGVSIDPTL